MWKLTVWKYSASRWSFTMENPSGGSFGTNAFKSQRGALINGGRYVPQGATVQVTVQNWNWEAGDYETTKTYSYVEA
jgi:hypothetical protein